MLLSDFNKIWFFSTEFGKSPQYQISQKKSIQWNPGWYTRTERRTDGRTESYDEAKGILSCLCERALKKRLEGWDTIIEGSMYRRRHLRLFAFFPLLFQTTF
jgi:hypothetical protein